MNLCVIERIRDSHSRINRRHRHSRVNEHAIRYPRKLPPLPKEELLRIQRLYRRRGQEMPARLTTADLHRLYYLSGPLKSKRKPTTSTDDATKTSVENKGKATTSTDDASKTLVEEKHEATTSADDPSKTLVEKHEATTSTDDALSH